MATAVLRSQGCLRHHRFQTESIASPSFRSCRNHNPNPNPSPCPNSMRSRRRKRSPVGFQDNSNNSNGRDRSRVQDRTVVTGLPAKNLVMGQVKILKRGEELKPATTRSGGFGDDDLVLSSTDRLGPDPETVQKQIRVSDLKVVDGLYAGSAVFLSSPPPSSLPLPAFFTKEKVNDVATSDLRRLLRLDLI